MQTYLSPLATVSLLVFAAGTASGQEAKKESPEQLVQRQVDAYNRRDLEAFLATYSPDVKLYDFPGKETLTGLEAIRKVYGKLFVEHPGLHVKIAKRIVQGDHVIDQEEGTTGKEEFRAVAIYRVKDGKIAAVWFVE